MAEFNIVMPKLGESVQEATIIKWFKKEGEVIQEEDPSPVDGVLTKILYKENDVVPVGEVIAVIDLGGEAGGQKQDKTEKKPEKKPQDKVSSTDKGKNHTETTRFYSPLVQSIAKSEGLTAEELEKIPGTGINDRVRKNDILKYIETRSTKQITSRTAAPSTGAFTPTAKTSISVQVHPGDEIVQMDRMRKMIAENMVLSKQISPHVTNFIEADVTNLVIWRNKIKDSFEKREKQKLTFMPVFIEATAKVLKEYRGVNASVDGDSIILRKNINIGVAVALPTGNLIVPVIRNADQKSILGLTTDLNTMANNARNNKLSPDDIQGGTFTISNFGSFRNLTGTPIINQPQVAILATGTIEKKPAVLETPSGDVIAIRHKMMLALTYDHRVVDGALAGAFLHSLADNLESYDVNRAV
jgi:2-oxoglutarate dehydrogenase E2 component (dihydrolipoamide succinyltransferase)